MDPLTEIKKRIDLVEYINKHVPLTKAGRNFKALCPFHSEKTPSFIVSPERQMWHCFGSCAEGGDVFKFLMKWENISFGEAVKLLAQQTNVPLKKTTFVDRTWERKQKLYALNQLAADFYDYLLLKHRWGESARSYLKSRKVNHKMAKHFGLGYAPNSWSSLSNFLQKKGYNHIQIEAAGLSIKTESNRYYDRFRGRLMFPLTNQRGDIVGFSGRILNLKAKDPSTRSGQEAKYINTPETFVYHKRENLFGLHLAKKSVQDKNEMIVVEGEFDTILAHQNSYTNTVAIKGSALTQNHLRLIKRLTNRLVFALDMDPAGSEAIKRGIEEAEKFDFQMQVIDLGENKDPADLFAKDPDQFKKIYKQKKTIYEYLIEQAVAKQDLETIYGKKAVVEEMLPYLNQIYNPILLDHYQKLLAKQTELPIGTITQSLHQYQRKLKQKEKSQVHLERTKRKKREQALEEFLVALLVQTTEQQYILNQTKKQLKLEDYYLKAVALLVQKAQEIYKPKDKNFLKKLGQALPQELMEIYNKGFLLELPQTHLNWQKEIKKTVLHIKKYALKRQIKELIKKNEQVALNRKTKSLREVEKTLGLM